MPEKSRSGNYLSAKENKIYVLTLTGCISNCRFAKLQVGGGDTAHGELPWLVSHQPATI